MRILVTGAAGFIGSHLVERLLSDGHQVLGMDDFNPSYDPEIKKKNLKKALISDQFQLMVVDIRGQVQLNNALAGQRFDAVIHLAARAGVRPSLAQATLYQEVNVGGTLNLLEEFREAGLKTFIFGSSSSVYGASSRIPFDEEDPALVPLSPYAATKRAAELLCRAYAEIYRLPITCLRFFTVYGPRQRPDMAISKFCRLMLEDKELPIYGNGSSARDYTFVDDIIDGIVASLARPFPFEIINLGNSAPVSLLEMVGQLEKALGKKTRLASQPALRADVPVTCADISKAKMLLGFAPRVSLEEGLQRFVNWLREVG